MNRKKLLVGGLLTALLLITHVIGIFATEDPFSPTTGANEDFPPENMTTEFIELPKENPNDKITDPNLNNSIPYSELNSNIKPKVDGGNINATNILATPPSKSRGTIIENVDQDNKKIEIPEKEEKEIDIFKPVETETKVVEEKPEYPIDMRQFLTFQTASGKEFHLIVDYSKDDQQVQMLTEVSEQDLLNLIEGESVAEKRAREEAERKAEEEARLKAEKEAKLKAEEEARANKPKKKSNALPIIIGIAGIAGLAFYFYTTKFKNKKTEINDDDDDYYEDDEYSSEYGEIEDFDEDEYYTSEDEDE